MEECSGNNISELNSAFSYLLHYSLIFSNIICSSDLCLAVRRIVFRLRGRRQYGMFAPGDPHNSGQNSGVGV